MRVMATVNRGFGSFDHRKAAAVAETVIPVIHRPENAGVPKTPAMTAFQALQAMSTGAVVRRVSPDNRLEKYHRIHNGEVQTADNDTALVEGRWERARTDIASWYASTFRRVKMKVEVVTIEYD